MSSNLDDIQSPFGQIMSRMPFAGATKPIEQPETNVDESLHDAKYMARLEDIYADCIAPTPTFTWMYMAFAPCPQGRIWEALRIGISAQTPAVLAGATAHIYKGVFVPQNSNVFSQQLVDFVAFQGQIPNTSYIGTRGLFLHPGERIIVAITGLLAAQSIGGSFGFIDRDMTAYLRSLG